MAEVRQRHAHVRLGATAVHLQSRLLQQQLVTGRPQAQQQLTKAQDAGTTHTAITSAVWCVTGWGIPRALG